MAAFLPLKSGGWAYGEILTSTQMNQLNTDFPYALNLRDGGSYTPSGAVTIATPTTQRLTFNSSYFTSAADGGGLNVVGANGLAVAGPSTLSGTVTVPGIATIGQLNGSTTLNGKIFPAGTGRLMPRVVPILADLDGSYGSDDGDVLMLDAGILSANRTITIIDAALGYEAIEIETLEPTYSLVIKHPVTLTTLVTMKKASGFAAWVRIRSTAVGVYSVVAKYIVP